MENSKRKGIISILIIAICLCLCIGATYAYFTDSATSKGNKIQAGKLKIDLELLDKTNLNWISISENEDPVFNYEYWEPGYTDVKILRVTNKGTLALQWNAVFISEEQVSTLAEVIEVYVKSDSNEFGYPASRDEALTWTKIGTLKDFINTDGTIASGELRTQNESAYFGIALYMPTTVEDNTLQGQSIDPFDIQILATQLSYESDAFDEKYDENAGSSNGGVTPPDTTESTEDTSSSEPEPTETEPTETEPTDTSSGEPTDEPEPTDPELFNWDVYDDHAVVRSFKDPHNSMLENLVIPSEYNGLPVTIISLRDDMNVIVKSVIIPDSVTTIDECGFWFFNGLTSITIPDSVTTIGVNAFWDCQYLASITFKGTIEQWNDVNKENYWDDNTGEYTIYCTNGTIAKDGTATYY